MKGTLLILAIFSCLTSKAITNSWTGQGGDSLWFNSMNWSHGIPSAVDTVIISGIVSGVGVSGNITIARLELKNAVLNTAASLSVEDSIIIDALSVVNWKSGPWAEGVFMNYGVINFNAPTGAVFYLNARLHNYSIFNHILGGIAFYGTFFNEASGLYDIQCDGCILNGVSNVTSEFFNYGLIKRNGSGEAKVVVKYHGKGSLDVQSGELSFRNSQTLFEQTHVNIEEDGILTMKVIKIDGIIHGSNLGSFIIQNLNVVEDSELSISNNGARWELLSWSGSAVIKNSGILAYTSSTSELILIEGLTLENQGTFIIKPDSFLKLLTIRGTLLNTGLIDFQNDSNFNGDGHLINEGTIQKTDGLGISHIDIPLSESGNINVITGTLKF